MNKLELGDDDELSPVEDLTGIDDARFSLPLPLSGDGERIIDKRCELFVGFCGVDKVLQCECGTEVLQSRSLVQSVPRRNG